jgi:hypothetical protein
MQQLGRHHRDELPHAATSDALIAMSVLAGAASISDSIGTRHHLSLPELGHHRTYLSLPMLTAL